MFYSHNYMNRTILISSTHYPHLGGSATNTYMIIKNLRNRGYHTIGIFYTNTTISVDPDNIGGVFKFNLEPFEKKDIKVVDKYRNLINSVGHPTVMLCKNYLCSIYCKLLYPKVKNIYLVSGITHFSKFFPDFSSQYLLSNNINIPEFDEEIQAIESSDLIVSNSPMTLKLLHKIYPKYINKTYPIVVDTSKEMEDMDLYSNSSKVYDFIITASILTRTDKNNSFLIDILNNKVFNKYTKLIVGNDNHKFKNIKNSTVLEIVPHKNFLELLSQCRVLLYPSLIDSNPNTIREAVNSKCLVVMSHNIGFFEKFPDFSICRSYRKDEWIRKSLYSIKNYNKLIDNYHIDFGFEENIFQFIEKNA